MNQRILSLFLVAGLLLSACSAPPLVAPGQSAGMPTQAASASAVAPVAESIATPAPPSTPTPILAAAAPAYEPVFEEMPCPFALRPEESEGETIVCGHVVVPMDRGDPAAGTIRLAVAVFKAVGEDPAPDPVILLSGGPGEKTMANAVAVSMLLTPFRNRRDLIVFDQRGVGLSQPALECPEILEARFDLIGELDSETALRTIYEAAMACGKRLQEEGHRLAAYNTTENAADVNDIRRALGYEKLNIYGGSYGSLLAQAVMRDHPEGLRSVIIGAILPAERSFIVNVPTTTGKAVLDLLEECAADEACAAAYPDLRQVLFDTIEELNADPAPVTVTNPQDGQSYDTWLTGDDVYSNLVTFLYFSDIIPVLPQAIYNVANGNYELMIRLMSTQFLMMDLLSAGMEFSVLCAEDLVGFTPQDYLAERAKLPAAMRGYADPEDVIEYGFFGICAGWPVAQADPSIKQPVKSAVPTLILEGQFDPVTPMVYAEEVAQHLRNSYLYEFPGIGHNVLVAAPCAREIASEFLEDPSKEPDSSCLAHMTGVAFDLPVEAAAGIELEPVAFSAAGLLAVKPVGWQEVSSGTYARRLNALDSTALIYDAAPLSQADFLQAIQAQISLPEPIERSGVRATESFTWTLYSTVVQGVVLDIAMTSWNDQTLMVLVQSRTDERDGLYEPLFLGAVDAVKPAE